jgi:hypothetical protein
MDGNYFEFRGKQGTTETTIRVSDESSIGDMVVAFRAYLLALGFHPKNVQEALPEER